MTISKGLGDGIKGYGLLTLLVFLVFISIY